MIAAEAKAAGVKPHPGVVDVSIAFVFERPKSHLRANGSLTPKALQLPPCDWDNLAKGVCDALTGIAYNDDRQIRQCIVWKDYGRRAETVIEIVFRGMRWQSS
jgi:Holliday junction resolvase RusA-like endonuclease